MFNFALRIASNGAKRLSCLAGLTSAPTLLQPPCSSSPASAMSIMNTVVPSRGKRFEHHFLNKWMYRDYKRRCLVKQHFPARLRMNAMKRCAVLPRDFQEVVSEELHAYPRDSCFVRMKPRCILTSRPRWVIHNYRLSRIQWRLLADYNKLSGVLRATW